MTAVVGIRSIDGAIWMGGDSAISDGCGMLYPLKDDKVFVVGEFLLGVCGDSRPGQVLRYQWCPPKQTGHCADDYLVRQVVPTIREVLNAAGSLRGGRDVGEAETSSLGIMLGYRGELYDMDEGFCISRARPSSDALAIGSGAEYAYGALYATRGQPPHMRIQIALDAASEYRGDVSPPYTVRTKR